MNRSTHSQNKESLNLRDETIQINFGSISESKEATFDLIELAKNKPKKSDNEQIVRILKKHNLSNKNNLTQAKKSVKQYRATHKRKKENIRVAKKRKDTHVPDVKKVAETGSSMSTSRLSKLISESLSNRDELHSFTKIYFGFKNITRPSTAPTPPQLKEDQEIIEQAGYSLHLIVDHFLIAQSLYPSSASSTLLSLFPAPDNQKDSDYKKSLQHVGAVLRGAHTPEVFELLIESAEFTAQLYNRHLSSFMTRKPNYTLSKNPGGILEVMPGLQIAPYLRKIKPHSQMFILSCDDWEGLVLDQIIEKESKSNIQVRQSTPREILKNNPLQSFETIHINGDWLLKNMGELDAIKKLTHKLQSRGQIVIDYSPTSLNRSKMTSANMQDFLCETVEELGCSLTTILGKTLAAPVESDIKRIFYPATFNTKDTFILSRNKSTPPEEEVKKLIHIRQTLLTYCILQDNYHYSKLVQLLSGLDSIKKMANIFSLSLNIDRSYVKSQSKALNLLNKGKYEELANFLVANELYSSLVVEDDEIREISTLGEQNIRNRDILDATSSGT